MTEKDFMQGKHGCEVGNSTYNEIDAYLFQSLIVPHLAPSYTLSPHDGCRCHRGTSPGRGKHQQVADDPGPCNIRSGGALVGQEG